MINFSKLHLVEDAIAAQASAASAEKANAGGEKQINDTLRRKDRQKAQMATQKSTPMKSDISYTSEDYDLRTMKEIYKMRRASECDWRDEIMEAAKPDEGMGEHPFVNVMPFVDYKAREAKKQAKSAMSAGGEQAKQGSEVPVEEAFIQEEEEKGSYSDKEFRDYAKKKGIKMPKSRPVNEDKKPLMIDDIRKLSKGERHDRRMKIMGNMSAKEIQRLAKIKRPAERKFEVDRAPASYGAKEP